MTRLWRVILPVALAASLAAGLAACEGGVAWNGAEKENARHVFRSLDAARAAATRVHELPARWQAGGEEVAPVIEALDDAILHANLVRQSVLTKAHPQLANRFRGEYQRSLGQLREFYRTGELPEREHPARVLGDFTEWFYGNQHEFRWWRGYRRDLGLE
jgi:hypothetical protein